MLGFLTLQLRHSEGITPCLPNYASAFIILHYAIYSVLMVRLDLLAVKSWFTQHSGSVLRTVSTGLTLFESAEAWHETLGSTVQAQDF
jgi:hypothetical protein